MCCGDKRAQLKPSPYPAEGAEAVYFQYTGRTGMTVIGRETRSKYRFDTSGTIVAVDARDQHAMSFVPNLRRVAGVTG